MSYPRRITIQWDESAGANRITVPFGHLWSVRWLFIRYVADANVSTRTIVLNIKQSEAAFEMGVLSSDITAGLTRTYLYGNEDAGGAFFLGKQAAQPVLLKQTDTITLTVTNEEAGDTWDVWGPVEDWVIPRA